VLKDNCTKIIASDHLVGHSHHFLTSFHDDLETVSLAVVTVSAREADDFSFLFNVKVNDKDEVI
jgi:hypothetical protein